MPKLKVRQAVAKRFKVTKSGKLLRSHQLRTNHLRRNKSKQALRRHQQKQVVSKADAKTIKRMLGI